MFENFILSIIIYMALIATAIILILSIFLLTIKKQKNATTKRKQEPTSVSTPSSSRQFRTFGSRRSRNDKTGIF